MYLLNHVGSVILLKVALNTITLTRDMNIGWLMLSGTRNNYVMNHIWIKNIVLIVPIVSSINCAANRFFQSNIDIWCQLFLVYVRLYVHFYHSETASYCHITCLTWSFVFLEKKAQVWCMEMSSLLFIARNVPSRKWIIS